MVTIGHRPSVARLEILDRAAGDLPALLLVLTPIGLLNVLVGTRAAGAAGPAESDAVVGASFGAGAPAADAGFLGQLSVVPVLTGAVGGSSLLQSARGLCLLAGMLVAALLWPVLRRLGVGGNAAATAVIIAGLGPLALRLQPSVDPGAVAAFWIALAAFVGFHAPGGPARRVVATASLLVAVITTPVAAAGLLAAGGYALAAGTLGARLRPSVRTGLAVLAGCASAAALGAGLLGAGRAASVPPLTLLALFGLAAFVLARAWVQRPELRAAICMAVVWLGTALVPGPARLTALLLAVPVMALLVGALLGEPVTDHRPRLSVAAATAVTVALVCGMVTGLWPTSPPPAASYEALARWLNRELEDNVMLSAAPLDRAELIAAGVPAQRFATDSVPDGAVTVVPDGAGCGQVGSPVVQLATVGGSLSVCAPASVGGPPLLSSEAGPQLADNPALRMPEPARQLLRDGRVDSRLMTVLAGVASTQPFEVVDFPAVPGEPDAAPRRAAVLAGVARAVDVQGRPAAGALELYLNAQRPPYRPDLRLLPDGGVVVHFRLAAPRP